MRMVEIVNTHDLFGIAWGGIVDDYPEFHRREEGERWEDWLGELFSLVFTEVG
jgi:hypothetical protein